MAMLFFDSGGFEWTAVASGALVLILGGIVVAVVQRRWSKEDDEEKAEKTAIKTELGHFGLQLATEREERRADLNNEAAARREKDDALGRDISTIREEISYQAGRRDREKPKFGRDS